MVLIGGVGNLYGPLLGAAVFKWLSEAVSVVWERWPLILGVAVVLVVLFLRGGLVEAFTRLRDAAGSQARGAFRSRWFLPERNGPLEDSTADIAHTDHQNALLSGSERGRSWPKR